MNVAAHQEKEKNEKTGKRKAGEERRQVTDLKETVCCPFAVVQGAARRKMACERGVPKVAGTLGKSNSHFDQTQKGWGQQHHDDVAVDWCSSILLALYTVHTTEISHFTI